MDRLLTAPWLRLLAVVFGVCLVVGACSDSDDDDSDSADADTEESTSEDEGSDGDESDDSTEEGGDSEEGTGEDGEGESSTADAGATLAAVRDAGEIKCGTRDALPGFAELTADGDHVGFDADFCRVIAAAVLGDANQVDFVDLETPDRFIALQGGEIDVLVRNTTWTAQRDGTEGATFLQPNFYDGQGMMVAADSEFESLEDMNDVVICVAQGTTTEGNAAAEASRLGHEPGK